MSGSAAMAVSEREVKLVVKTALECAGFQCMEFSSTVALLRGVKREGLRLIVLDADSQEVDATSVFEWRRNWLNPSVVIIAIGANDTKTAVRALEAGADDYVAKPVPGAELIARIKAATRRREGPAHTGSLELAGCTLNRDSLCLQTSRLRVALTGREVAVLQVLFENVGEIVTRKRLATEVWGADADLSGKTIVQHIYQVRRKLKQCIGDALCVRSVYGSGYRLEQPSAARSQDDALAKYAQTAGIAAQQRGAQKPETAAVTSSCTGLSAMGSATWQRSGMATVKSL
jgi:DNA-binding response OmpR family regulator